MTVEGGRGKETIEMQAKLVGKGLLVGGGVPVDVTKEGDKKKNFNRNTSAPQKTDILPKKGGKGAVPGRSGFR